MELKPIQIDPAPMYWRRRSASVRSRWKPRRRAASKQAVDYHYHEFDKLILLLGGKAAYLVEGVTYFLQPWDILLVVCWRFLQ